MENVCLYKKEDDGRTHPAVVVAWEEGVKSAYPVAKKLHGDGREVDVILGFSDASHVDMECEYAAISDRLYVFTPNGSFGACAVAEQAIFDMLEDEDDRPQEIYVYCPQDMSRRIQSIFV